MKIERALNNALKLACLTGLAIMVLSGCVNLEPTRSTTPAPPATTVRNLNLFSYTVSVAAGTYYDLPAPFVISNGQKNAHLSGSFQSSGGPIAVYILSDSSFSAWRTTGTMTNILYYASATSGSINADAPAVPDSYHFIFDNTGSTTTRIVTATLNVSWTSMRPS